MVRSGIRRPQMPHPTRETHHSAFDGRLLNENARIDCFECRIHQIDTTTKERVEWREPPEVATLPMQPADRAIRRLERLVQPIDEGNEGFQPLPRLMLRERIFRTPAIHGTRLHSQDRRKLCIVDSYRR